MHELLGTSKRDTGQAASPARASVSLRPMVVSLLDIQGDQGPGDSAGGWRRMGARNWPLAVLLLQGQDLGRQGGGRGVTATWAGAPRRQFSSSPDLVLGLGGLGDGRELTILPASGSRGKTWGLRSLGPGNLNSVDNDPLCPSPLPWASPGLGAGEAGQNRRGHFTLAH